MVKVLSNLTPEYVFPRRLMKPMWKGRTRGCLIFKWYWSSQRLCVR